MIKTWFAGLALAVAFVAVPPTDLIVFDNPDGTADIYNCEEDSPPPCVWDCAEMGNKICGGIN